MNCKNDNFNMSEVERSNSTRFSSTDMHLNNTEEFSTQVADDKKPLEKVQVTSEKYFTKDIDNDQIYLPSGMVKDYEKVITKKKEILAFLDFLKNFNANTLSKKKPTDYWASTSYEEIVKLLEAAGRIFSDFEQSILKRISSFEILKLNENNVRFCFSFDSKDYQDEVYKDTSIHISDENTFIHEKSDQAIIVDNNSNILLKEKDLKRGDNTEILLQQQVLEPCALEVSDKLEPQGASNFGTEPPYDLRLLDNMIPLDSKIFNSQISAGQNFLESDNYQVLDSYANQLEPCLSLSPLITLENEDNFV